MGKIKIDKADKAFSLYIRTSDGWNCKRCGTHYEPPTSALHCSHFQGRAKENTRFDENNADALCYGCHQYFTSHPAEHYMWQVKQKGQEKVDNIVLASNTYCKKDRDLWAVYWTNKLKELKNI